MPNSWHKAVNDFSPRLAVTTKLTRCSRTSIVFHGIDRYAPALAALAPECKGCLETFCKGCHGTEHVLWLEWGCFPGESGPGRLVEWDKTKVKVPTLTSNSTTLGWANRPRFGCTMLL